MKMPLFYFCGTFSSFVSLGPQKNWWQLKRQGYHLFNTWAPPCNSMTRACQRNVLVRVRSAGGPWGIAGLSKKKQSKAEHDTKMAIATDHLAGKAHFELGAHIMGEIQTIDLSGSYVFFQWPDYMDARFSPCMVGDDIAKPTRVR